MQTLSDRERVVEEKCGQCEVMEVVVGTVKRKYVLARCAPFEHQKVRYRLCR